MRAFVDNHNEWLHKVGEKHLKGLGISLKKYIKQIFAFKRQFDVFTYLIFARCFHIHICLIVSDGFWTTQAVHDAEKCDIFLAYTGAGYFSDTVRRSGPPIAVTSAIHPTQGSAINLSNRKRPRQIYKVDENKKRRRRHSSGEKPITRSDGVLPKKPFKRTSRTSSSAGLFKLEDVIGTSKKRKVRPKNLTEQDPVLNAFKNVDPNEVLDMLKSDEENEKKKDKTNEKDVPTDLGLLNIKTVGIQKKKTRKRMHSCSRCEKKVRTLAELEEHNRNDHDGEPFSCTVSDKCTKKFKGYNALHKHEQKHFIYKYFCTECGKRFQFPRDLSAHEATHDESLKLPCTYPKCKEKCRDKFSLKQHLSTHFKDNKYRCDDCERDFTDRGSYKQHMKGKHGDGYKTLCGKTYAWPDGKNAHEQGCDLCIDMKIVSDNRMRPAGKPFTTRVYREKAIKKNEQENQNQQQNGAKTE